MRLASATTEVVRSYIDALDGLGIASEEPEPGGYR